MSGVKGFCSSIKKMYSKVLPAKKAAKFDSHIPIVVGSGRQSDMRLYECMGGDHRWLIVSAVHAWSGPETYIFPANEKGEVTNWHELDGSFQGGMDHELALQNAGYEIVTDLKSDSALGFPTDENWLQ